MESKETSLRHYSLLKEVKKNATASMVAHTCNPSSWAEAKESLYVQGYLGTHSVL